MLICLKLGGGWFLELFCYVCCYFYFSYVWFWIILGVVGICFGGGEGGDVEWICVGWGDFVCGIVVGVCDRRVCGGGIILGLFVDVDGFCGWLVWWNLWMVGIDYVFDVGMFD